MKIPVVEDAQKRIKLAEARLVENGLRQLKRLRKKGLVRPIPEPRRES